MNFKKISEIFQEIQNSYTDFQRFSEKYFNQSFLSHAYFLPWNTNEYIQAFLSLPVMYVCPFARSENKSFCWIH